MEYNHKDIEGRIHRYWADKDIYRVSIDSSRPKFYVLDMFPYPCLLYTSDAADER